MLPSYLGTLHWRGVRSTWASPKTRCIPRYTVTQCTIRNCTYKYIVSIYKHGLFRFFPFNVGDQTLRSAWQCNCIGRLISTLALTFLTVTAFRHTHTYGMYDLTSRSGQHCITSAAHRIASHRISRRIWGSTINRSSISASQNNLEGSKVQRHSVA